jgi:hypothetical protein
VEVEILGRGVRAIVLRQYLAICVDIGFHDISACQLNFHQYYRQLAYDVNGLVGGVYQELRDRGGVGRVSEGSEKKGEISRIPAEREKICKICEKAAGISVVAGVFDRKYIGENSPGDRVRAGKPACFNDEGLAGIVIVR